MANMTKPLVLSIKSFEIVDLIDSCDFLNIGKSSASRSDMTMFAVAMGLNEGTKAPIVGNKYFDRFEYLKGQNFSQLIAVLIKDNKDLDIDIENCCNDNEVMDLASAFANTGLDEIRKLYEGCNMSTENATLALAERLDKKYEELFGKDIS